MAAGSSGAWHGGESLWRWHQMAAKHGVGAAGGNRSVMSNENRRRQRRGGVAA
jgi:hypothetical protein